MKPAANGAAGFLIALLVWLGLSAPYARLLAGVSEAAIHAGEWPSATVLTVQGTLIAVDRIDFPPAPGRLAIESTDLTFNVILLVTLFAATRRPLSNRNLFGLLGASCLLLFVHVFAVVSFVKAHYALNFGSWSEANYGVIARSFWGAAPYFYSVAGVYGFAFALWWLFRPPPMTSPPAAVPRAVRRRQRG
ncbi:MAG: hypothetical protein WA208_11355 [Thermoanaerobaculia bacterium]